MSPLFFVGSNHNIQQMIDIATLNNFEVVGIIDNDYYRNTNEFDGVAVIDSENSHQWSKHNNYFLASNWFPTQNPVHARNRLKRKRLIQILDRENIKCVNLIHPAAIVPKSVNIDNGVLICAGAIIGNAVKIGNYAQVREHSYIAHNSVIGDNSILQVYAYVGSNIVVQNNCYLGVRSTCIESGTVISAGSFLKSHCMHQKKHNCLKKMVDM